VIGKTTLELAAEAGLKGMAVQAAGALVLQREALVRAADDAGMFLFGFSPEEPTK
jgi:DUF1009 family protein